MALCCMYRIECIGFYPLAGKLSSRQWPRKHIFSNERSWPESDIPYCR
jgi:hypothetical protein